MKTNVMCFVAVLAIGSTASANVVTLEFNPNHIFNYATSDGARSDQQGTARAIWGQGRTPLNLNGSEQTDRYYQTYNDGADPSDRMDDATAAKDLQSVANILGWTATAGHQGVNWFQLYLQAGSGSAWGENVVFKDSSSWSASVNGEFGWRLPDEYGNTPVFDTLLGADPNTNQNAFSPDFNPAEQLFSITADFYLDNNGNGEFDAGDSDLVIGQDYTIWFYAKLNNWTYTDDYGNSAGGNPGYIEGTIIASAVPEPSAIVLLTIAGLTALAAAWVRRRKA